MVLDPNSAGQPVVDPNATPAADAGTTPPVADTGTPAPEDPQKMVPLAALHEERNNTKALKDEIDALKQAMYSTPQQPQQQQNPYQQQQQPYNPQQNQQQQMSQQLEEMWDDDPRKAMQTEVMMALNWYDQANASVDVQESQAAKAHTDFDNYRNEVRQYIRTLPVTERSNPGMVESAYYFVKGRYSDDVVKKSEEAILAKIRAGEYAQGINYGAGSPAVPVTAAQATPQQAQMAANMGMSVEDYMKGVK